MISGEMRSNVSVQDVEALLIHMTLLGYLEECELS
jgi:hypothetical protein